MWGSQGFREGAGLSWASGERERPKTGLSVCKMGGGLRLLGILDGSWVLRKVGLRQLGHIWVLALGIGFRSTSEFG